MQLEELSNISDNLAMMADPALQQFAQMHKQDPYMVSLALSESNRRKKMRTAAQGQAGAAPQPKVVDAAIQGMTPAPAPVAQTQLPENQGIAQIPTPNMQRLADGGIAGYEDDEEGMATGGMGGMFNFAQQNEPVVRMSGGGVARYNGATGSVTGVSPELLSKYQQEATEMAMGTRMQFSPDVKAVVGQIQAAQEGSYLKAEQKQMLEGSPLRNKTQASASMVAPTAPTVSAAYDPTENLKKLAQTNARYTTPSAPKNAEEAAMLNRYPATKPAAKKDDAVAAPTAGGGVKDLLPDSPKLDTSYKPVAAPTAADAKSKASELYDSKGQRISLEGKQAQARQDIFNQRDERLAQLTAFSKEQGPAFANYEKMLQKEELQDTTDKEKAGLMSLMKGFLAMAAGESPNAATNIAKGAMVGLGDYGDALKEFKKAAKERNKAMADIENARRAEAKGDFKDQQTFTDRANERLAASDDRFTGLISQITGKEADVAASLLNNMTNNAEETSRMLFKERGINARAAMSENRADLRSQTPDKRVFDALVTQYGDPVKAAEALQKMKAEKFNLYEAYNKYLTAFAGKDTMTPPMAFDLFAKQFIPEVNPNKNTTIRTQPGG
jgi:hypothetical protein